VNLPEHGCTTFQDEKGRSLCHHYPVSIGKMDWSTPLGETRVISKQKNPSWYPPESVRKEHLANGDPLPKGAGGPDNPLGDFAMRLAVGGGSYMLHAPTIRWRLDGHHSRLHPPCTRRMLQRCPAVPVGTKVWLINDPVKLLTLTASCCSSASAG